MDDQVHTCWILYDGILEDVCSIFLEIDGLKKWVLNIYCDQSRSLVTWAINGQ